MKKLRKPNLCQTDTLAVLTTACREHIFLPGRIADMDKDHWYDGRFYDRLIAPHQDPAFLHLKALITRGSTLLDAGCGTGRMAFQLAGHCSSIDALDPSKRNIDTALRTLHRYPTANIRFHHIDVLSFLERTPAHFDVATMSLVIHEIEESQRVPVLQALASAARRVILVDYLVPQPSGSLRLQNTVVEFLGGRDHYRCFRSFVAGNGLTGLIERSELSIVSEMKNDPPSTHIMLVKGRTA